MCGESFIGRNDAHGDGTLDDGGGWFLIFVTWKDDPTAATSVFEFGHQCIRVEFLERIDGLEVLGETHTA